MNEELQQALAQFLTASLNTVEKGTAIAGEQIPLVLQEIVQWKITESAIASTTLFLFIIASCLMLRRIMRSFLNIEDKQNLGAFCVVVNIPFIVLFFVKFMTLIKAITAPRLIIIEFLKGML